MNRTRKPTKNHRSRKMAQQVRILVLKPNYQVSSSEYTRWKERINSYKLTSDLHMHLVARVHSHTDTHIHTRGMQTYHTDHLIEINEFLKQVLEITKVSLKRSCCKFRPER